MQHPGSAQNLSRQSSHQSLSPPYSRDQNQFALRRHQGQPSPYLSRHEGRGDRSHGQYNQDSQNAPQRGNMVKIDNVTSDRRRRNAERDIEQSMRIRMDSQPVPHFEPPINQSNQYYPSGDDRQNLSYDSRVSADQSRYNLSEDPRLARHESQRSVNYQGHQNPNVSRHESQRSLANSGQPDTHVSRHESQRSLANVGHPDMPVSRHESQRSLANKGQPDMPVSRHESQRSLINNTQQPYNQSNAFSGPPSHQPAESPYVSRRRDPNSTAGSQSLQNQPVSTAPIRRDMHPPSRQPPSPYMSQDQRSRSQQDVPPSPYMSRHQAPESPYMSRNASQRSVPHNIQSQSVSRHESQKSISSPNHPISSPDMQGYQPSSSNSTLTRYPSHQLYGDEPSATSTLLRHSHDRQSREQPPSATSTLTRGMSNSHQNQAHVHASQTSLNQRPLYTRQNSEPPPPYQTFDRQHSRGEEKHFQDQDLHQQSVHEDRQVSRSQSQSRQPDQRMTPKLSRYESERSVARTQQSGYSQHSRASSLSNSHPIPDVRGLEASSIIDILQKEFVILTGGRDRQGGPVITFPPNRHIQPNFTAEDIAICLKYFAQIPSEESKRRGITVVIDSRDGSWSNLVTVLGCLKESLGESLKQVLVIKPDNAADRRSSSNSFRRDRDRPNIEGSGAYCAPSFISCLRSNNAQLANDLETYEETSIASNQRSYWGAVCREEIQSCVIDVVKDICSSRVADFVKARYSCHWMGYSSAKRTTSITLVLFLGVFVSLFVYY